MTKTKTLNNSDMQLANYIKEYGAEKIVVAFEARLRQTERQRRSDYKAMQKERQKAKKEAEKIRIMKLEEEVEQLRAQVGIEQPAEEHAA